MRYKNIPAEGIINVSNQLQGYIASHVKLKRLHLRHVSPSTSSNEHSGDPNIAQRLRYLQSRDTLISPGLNIHTLLHQHLRHVSMASLHRTVQRTVPILIPGVRINPSLQQSPNRFHPPLKARPMQRRPSILVPPVNHRATLNQPLNTPHLPLPRRKAQTIPKTQRVEHTRVSILRRHVIRSLPRKIPHVLIGSLIQQELHHALVPQPRCHV
ncbi:hypothetical protein CR513_48817, partial [Mucuna pruriens]